MQKVELVWHKERLQLIIHGEYTVKAFTAQYFLTSSFQMPRQFHFYTKDGLQRFQLTEEHIDAHILPIVERKLLLERPLDTTLLKQKLLHVTFDNDKVKGEVLYLVIGNI